MSCHWCFKEQTEQPFVGLSQKSLSYRNPYVSDLRKKNKQLSGVLEQKISLRKKKTVQVSSFHLESSNRYKNQSLRIATSPNSSFRPPVVSQNNKNQIFYQQKKYFLPFIYTPKTSSLVSPIAFTTNLNKNINKKTENYLRTTMPVPQRCKKIISPQISFTHHQVQRTPRINYQNSHINCFPNEPFKIKTIIKSPEKYEELKPIPQQENSGLQKKWSLQNNVMNPQKEENMIEEGNALQLKKYNSTSLKIIQDNRESKLVKSTRAFNSNNFFHLEDIQCKKTESVADAHKQSDEYSQIIRDDDFPSMKKRKMTSSQTNILKSQKNSLQQFKRSIGIEPSRNQSYNQQ